MDWGWLACGAVVVTNALLIGVWRPFFSGYAEQKGKNLATKEDIAKLVEQIRQVTETQEVIKARVSMGVWQDQRVWDERRVVFARALALLDSMYDAASRIPGRQPTPTETKRSVLDVLERHAAEFRQTKSLVAIFLGPTEVSLLVGCVVAGVDSGQTGDVSPFQDELRRAEESLIAKAQAVFGIGTADSSAEDTS